MSLFDRILNYANQTKSSTRELIGIKGFTDIGIDTAKGELVLYRVSPVNITVLSDINIRIKIRNLTMMLSSIPDLEMCCLNSAECFEDNKLYLQNRIQQETCPQIKGLLKKDLLYLDQIQIEMSTAREFLFLIRFRNESREQAASNLNRIEKTMKEYGFTVHRADQDEMKRIFAIYFEGDTSSEQFPDYDGEQWITGGDDTEKEIKTGASAGSGQAGKKETNKTSRAGSDSKPTARSAGTPRKPRPNTQGGKPIKRTAGQKAKISNNTAGEKSPKSEEE